MPDSRAGSVPTNKTRGLMWHGASRSAAESPLFPGFLTAAAMVIAGPILMGASPARPVVEQRGGGGRRPDEVGEQMTHFAGGKFDEGRGDRRLLVGSRMRAVLDTEADQEGVGEQDQGDMAIPAEVAAVG
jgi:hypothetical protein